MEIKRRYDAKKLDPFSPPGTKYLCPWNQVLERIPHPDCSPNSKRDRYVMCEICKTLQKMFPRVGLRDLPAYYRKNFGPDPDAPVPERNVEDLTSFM